MSDIELNKTNPKSKTKSNNNSIIITINFYNNGYIISHFDTNEIKLNIDSKLNGYFEYLKNTIKEIKKIINIKYLKLPNLSILLNETSKMINYSTLMNGTIIVNGRFDILKYQTDVETKKNNGKLNNKLFIERLRKHMTSFHQFISRNQPLDNVITIYYKQVNHFYSDLSIIKYLNYKLEHKSMSEKELEHLFVSCEKIFFIDTKKIKKLYNQKENYILNKNDKLLNSIEIKLKFDNDGNVEFHFDNIDKYNTVKLILFYFKILFSNIQYEIKNINDNQISEHHYDVKPIDKDVKKTEKKTHRIPIKSKVEKSKVENNLDLDLDIDLEQLDIDFDLDQLDIGDNDNGDNNIGSNIKDYSELEKMIENEKNIEKGTGKSTTKSTPTNKEVHQEQADETDFHKINKKNKKQKISKYMTNMRKEFDEELYYPKKSNKDYSYERDCQQTNMKQPYIVTKKEIDSFDDPEALTGYIKYNKNYYICPRIWDTLARKPVSATRFIGNGLKSPYSNGLSISLNKSVIDDKHTVIIRKPGTSSYWEDNTLHKDWPTILKKTEKDAYPMLMKPPNHPNKMCVPCCGSKAPDDFDATKNTIQQFFKLKKSKTAKDCSVDVETQDNTSIVVDTSKDTQSFVCSHKIENIQYISDEVSDLGKCRFGLLPKNLDILLNNQQDIFLQQNGTTLKDHSNLFLRRGVDKNYKDNILETFSVIMNYSLEQLKQLLIKKLTPDVFITLNNGELIDIYSSSNILPNSSNDYENFNKFITHYYLIFNLMDIDISILERLQYKDIEIINTKINNNTILKNSFSKKTGFRKSRAQNAGAGFRKSPAQSDSGSDSEDEDKKDTILEDDIDNLKKLILFYKIYRSFYNFIEHIADDKETKNYTHFLDLFSKPIEWLNKEGCNILIFEENGGKLLCNPYCDKLKQKYIIMIQEKMNHFIPLFHINYVYKNGTISGIFNYKSVNLNLLSYNFFEKKKVNVKLLDLAKHRDDKLINLIVIHSTICKYEYQQNTETIIQRLEDLDIHIVNQIVMTTTQIEFIKLSNKLLLPIYPLAIRIKQVNNKFKFLELKDMCSLNDYIDIDNKNFEKKLLQNGYKISKIFYDELQNMIISVQFENNLIVPIVPEKYTLNNKNSIISTMIKHNLLTSLNDIRIENLFRPAYFNFHLEISPEMNVLNLRNNIYKDFIYNYFKYEFSRILQEKTYKHSKQVLITMIHKYTDNKMNFNNVIDSIVDLIIHIMKSRIYTAFQKRQDLENPARKFSANNRMKSSENDYILLKECSKTKKNTKFCKYNEKDKTYYLDMNNQQLEYFSYLLANDLINKKMEKNEILNGLFIPEFNIRDKIYQNPNEIIISSSNELLNNLETGLYSKYKQNILLSNVLKDKKDYIYTEDDINKLELINTNEIKALMDTVITELVDFSIRNIFTEDKIFTTPFDKNGVYDKTSHIDECKFPYIDKKTGKYIYKCTPKPNGYMCPTKLDYTRTKAENWGYCPEKIEATKKQLKVIEIDTAGDANNKEYKEGKCHFPFINKTEGKDTEVQYNLKYGCNEVKDSNNKELFSWCPIKYNSNATKTKKNDRNNRSDRSDRSDRSNRNDKDDRDIGTSDTGDTGETGDLLKASSNDDTIHIGKWYNGKFLINKLSNKKTNKGYCSPPKYTKKNIKNTSNNNNDNSNSDTKKKYTVLTLDNYKPGNCNKNMTPSKGGYKRDQLYDFGVNVLKIPHTKLRKDNKIDGGKLSKDDLCIIVNNKYREIQKYGSNMDDIRLTAYEKDINLCTNGESKGGYTKSKLKDIAITYFDITENEIKSRGYEKEDLCKYISKIINNIKKTKDGKEGSDSEESESESGNKKSSKDNLEDAKYNMTYPGDIKLCNETPNKGGFNLIKVKQIAENHFNIDTKHKKKNEICDLITEKLNTTSKKNRTKTPVKKSTSDSENDSDEEAEDEGDEEDGDEEDDEDENEEEEEDNTDEYEDEKSFK